MLFAHLSCSDWHKSSMVRVLKNTRCTFSGDGNMCMPREDTTHMRVKQSNTHFAKLCKFVYLWESVCEIQSIKESNTQQTVQPTFGAWPKQPGVFAPGCIIGCQTSDGKCIANCGEHYAQVSSLLWFDLSQAGTTEQALNINSSCRAMCHIVCKAQVGTQVNSNTRFVIVWYTLSGVHLRCPTWHGQCINLKQSYKCAVLREFWDV